MNQDECFEQMTEQLTGTTPSIFTYNNGGRRSYAEDSSDTAAMKLVDALMSTNLFSCSLLITSSLSQSRTYLVRDQVYLERHGLSFLLKGTYRLHASRASRYQSDDPISTAQNEMQTMSRRGSNNFSDKKYRTSINRLFGLLNSRQRNYSSGNAYHLDGAVVTLTLSGRIPEDTENVRLRALFASDRTQQNGWSSIIDIADGPYVGLNLRGADFNPTRNILNFEGLTSEGTGNLTWYGQLQFHDSDTPFNSVSQITDLDRRLIHRQINYSDESVYTDYIPSSNLLEQVFAADADSKYGLYRINGREPVKQSGKELSDWLVDNELHVSSAIELFRLSDERTVRLSPGVYQLLKDNEDERYSCDLLTYSVEVSDIISNSYRAIFPSGKMQSMITASDDEIVSVSHITTKELFLPSEGEEVTTFFQSNKKI